MKRDLGQRVSVGILLWCLVGSGGLVSLALAQPESAGESSAPPPLEVPKAKGAFLGHRAAIEIGLAQHPLLRRAKQIALAAEAVAEQAKANYYPQIDAYAIQTGGTIRPLAAFNLAGVQNKPTSYIQHAGVLANQLISDFGRTAHKVLAELAGKEAAEKDVLTHKALVILKVQQAYLHCLRQKRLVQIAEETVRERGMIHNQIAILYKRQLKSKLDLDLISVELRNAEVQLLQAKNELRAAFAALNNAMGVRGAEDYTLEDVSAETPTDTLESLIQHALEDRPELLGSSHRILQADENLRAAQALHLPTLSAMGMSGVSHFSDAPTNQYLGSHPGETNLWWGAGATLSVPLFTGFLIENRVAEARQQRHKAEQKKLDVSNQVSLEVTDAYLTFQTAEQQTKVEEKEVEAARSALTLARERYRLGLASIVDVTSATTARLMAEVRLSEVRYAVQASAVALAFAIGKAYREF